MKKISTVILLLTILSIAALTGLYITDTFQMKDHISKISANIPFVSEYLGLDIKYRVSSLKQKEYEDKILEDGLDKIEYIQKNTIVSHEDRYLGAIIFTPEETEVNNEKTEEKYNYPSPSNQEYSLEDLEKLADIYSSMEPVQAIPILDQFEDQVIIDIFSQMKAKKVAEIMAELDPKRASIISLKMLEPSEK